MKSPPLDGWVELQFVLGRGWTSRLIAWFGGGDKKAGFSHVDARMRPGYLDRGGKPIAAGTLLGSRSDIIKPLNGGPPIAAGVQIRPAGYEHWKRRVVMKILCTKQQEETFYRGLISEIGKPYDRLAILGYFVGRDWRDPRKWYCMEVDAYWLERAKIVGPLLFTPNKITPNAGALMMNVLRALIEH